MRMKIIATLTLACSLLFIAGCQGYKTSVIHDKSISFDEGSYKSFQVQHARKSLDGEYEEIINAAISKVMSQKGYIVGNNPDLIIRYSIRTRTGERLEVEEFSETGHPAHMEAVFEARMLVNVVETSSGNVVWKAAGTRDLRQVNLKNFGEQAALERMEELFTDFPER